MDDTDINLSVFLIHSKRFPHFMRIYRAFHIRSLSNILIKVICIVQKVLIDLASLAGPLVAFRNVVAIRAPHSILQS
nr:MAG TPA: hypothetical protein [Caudoviricetes sp.]